MGAVRAGTTRTRRNARCGGSVLRSVIKHVVRAQLAVDGEQRGLHLAALSHYEITPARRFRNFVQHLIARGLCAPAMKGDRIDGDVLRLSALDRLVQVTEAQIVFAIGKKNQRRPAGFRLRDKSRVFWHVE